MADQYYIRIRGETKGPLSHEQIAAQIRRKRLGRHHELSTDAVNWEKAGNMPEFFEPAISTRERPAEITRDESEPIPLSPGPVADSGASPKDEEWFYTKSGNKLGPVATADIQMWLASGRLKSTDPVWNSSLDNWIPAGDLPQFAVHTQEIKQKSPVDRTEASFFEIVMGTSRARKLPGDAIHKYPNLTRYLRIAESVLRIAFTLSVCLCVGYLIFAAGLATNQENWPLFLAVLIAGPLQILLLWFTFISLMAALEFIRVVINIEDNTSDRD